MRLSIVPCELDDANEFVREHHRHHPAVKGHKFSLAVVAETRIVGVAIVGRPNARGLQDGWTLEVTRVATDGTKDACSALYGAGRRAAFALGYRKLVTYILITEPGTSLRAAGWKEIGAVRGRSWSCPSRPRVDKHPLQDKLRWEVSAAKPCSSCGKDRDRPGQAYCKACHRENSRKYRADQKARQRAIEAELKELRQLNSFTHDRKDRNL